MWDNIAARTDGPGADPSISQVAGGVVDPVLYDNFLQAQILAQKTHSSPTRLEAYEEMMLLEDDGLLASELEYPPSTDEINDRSPRPTGLDDLPLHHMV